MALNSIPYTSLTLPHSELPTTHAGKIPSSSLSSGGAPFHETPEGGARSALSSDAPSEETLEDSAQPVLHSGEIDRISQALANAQDSIALIRTAQDGQERTLRLLQHIRAMAVAAAEGDFNARPDALAERQMQIEDALAAIRQLADTTQFNGTRLLDGSAGVTTSLLDATTVSGIRFGPDFAGGAIGSSPVFLTVHNAATQTRVVGTFTYATALSLISTRHSAGGTLTINGQTIAVHPLDTVRNLLARINAASATTGVCAAFVAANGSGSIVLTQRNYGSLYRIDASETVPLVLGADAVTTSGRNAKATVSAWTQAPDGFKTKASRLFSGGTPAPGAAGIQVTDASGAALLLTQAGNSPDVVSRRIGTITAHAILLQTGMDAGEVLPVSLGVVEPTALGTGVVPDQSLAQIDIATPQGAQNAIAVSSSAITQVAAQSALLAALQSETLYPHIADLSQRLSALATSPAQSGVANHSEELTQRAARSVRENTRLALLNQGNISQEQAIATLL